MSVGSDMERSFAVAALEQSHRAAARLGQLDLGDVTRDSHLDRLKQVVTRFYPDPVRLVPQQVVMVNTYLRTGRLSAVGDRGAGKSFVLAFIAACELAAGYRVSYRSAMGHHSDEWMREHFCAHIDFILGPGRAKAHLGRHSLILPTRQECYHLRIDADLCDEVWLGRYFRTLDAPRYAAVGSLPEGTVVLGPPPRNPYIAKSAWPEPPPEEVERDERIVPVRDAFHLAQLRADYLSRQAAPPAASAPTPPTPAPLQEEGADVCIRVGPNGVERP